MAMLNPMRGPAPRIRPTGVLGVVMGDVMVVVVFCTNESLERDAEWKVVTV